MARSLIAALTLLSVTVRPAAAHEVDIPDRVAEAAQAAEVDSLDLLGAVITTGTDDPYEYLYGVGELARPVKKPTVATVGTAAYIASQSRYGQRAVCVSRIETGAWTAFYNPTPVGREHAQGYFGWLPSTAATVGAQIMNLDSEIRGFDIMLDRGRGREFYGIAAGIC